MSSRYLFCPRTGSVVMYLKGFSTHLQTGLQKKFEIYSNSNFDLTSSHKVFIFLYIRLCSRIARELSNSGRYIVFQSVLSIDKFVEIVFCLVLKALLLQLEAKSIKFKVMYKNFVIAASTLMFEEFRFAAS